MTRLISLYIFLNICNCCFGQLQTHEGPPRHLTTKEEKIDADNHNCLYQNKFTSRQRLEIFPFSKSSKIQIVSFDKPDSIIVGGEIPIKNNVVDYSKLIDVKTLSSTQIDTLTDILYNYIYKGTFFTFFKSNCYNPKNAILFIDNLGRVYAFIELCFECNAFRTSDETVQVGDFCDQKYDMLKSFFARLGVAFGTKAGSNDE